MNKTVITNFFSLSSLQIANYIIPVITVPYVVRVIGPGNYGLTSFANAFIAYFILIVNFGFDLTASRDISINRNNNEKISEIFFSVIAAKIFLFIVTLILFIISIIIIPRLHQDLLLYIVTYGIIIGNIFFPTWLFQGMEKLSRTAFFSLIARLIFTCSIFLLIKKEGDYILLQALYSGGQFVVGIAAFIYAIKLFKIRLYIPGIKKIYITLKSSFTLFVSSVVINIYTTSNVVILGFFATNVEVGYFSAAMKFMYITQGLFVGPFSQTMYPYIANAFTNSFDNGVKKLKTIFAIVLTLTFLTSILLLLFSHLIISIFFGNKFIPAILTLQIISFLPLIIGISQVCGTLALLNLKYDKIILRICAIGALLNIIFNLLLTPALKGNGTALAWLLTELYISGATYYILRRKGINLFSWNEIINMRNLLRFRNN